VSPELKAAIAGGRAGQALALIHSLPAAERERFDIAAHEADILGRLGRHDEEIALLGRLIVREPGNASLRLGLMNALKTVGRTADAIASARAALAINPGYGKAWWLLADLKTFAFSDYDLAAMQAALGRQSTAADRHNLHFALGRAFEQRGDAASAFAHYAEGNALAAAGAPAGTASIAARTDAAIAALTPAFFAERQGFGYDSDAPIFIVGLHRSGSTLIEQILAAHPEIEATSELTILVQLMREIAFDASLAGATPMERLASIDADRARSLGQEYLDRAADYRTTRKARFTDKMPANWAHVGLIQLILPNAIIIDARRHPMATGFSNFRQNYGAGAAWSFSLDGIGHYYADYLRFMRHFDRVLPGKVHHAINERLIEDFEPEVRRLLDHAGVAFDPATLEFHRTARTVRSASAEQVRRPVNRDGVDQWRAFEPWLQPLKDALGPALEDWQE
jgi:tetratricopeptide (TPR) repeat protein